MTSEHTYLLGSGPPSRESGRLDVQHVFFGKITGELVPKSISSHLGTVASPRIADIGTGTAVWLIDIGSQLPPTSHLAGFDITEDTFPPADKRPENLTLHKHNAVEPFPEEHLGKYDLVHARALMYGLKKDEWVVVARNMAGLLKPGGWLLWEDTGYTSWVCLPPLPGITEALAVDIEFAKKLGRDVTHPSKLPAHIEAAGFVDCSVKDHDYFSLSNRRESGEIFCRVLTSALRGIAAKGGISQEEADRMLKNVKDDTSSDKYLGGLQLRWVWGRKPE